MTTGSRVFRRGPGKGQLGLQLELDPTDGVGRGDGNRKPTQPGLGALLPAPARRPLSAVRIAHALGRPEPTPEQVAVIEAPLEPLLVVAGAGSGKTETMASRVVWLVANHLVEPDQVLGLTFTRKAAGELAERVRSRLRALARLGALGGTGAAGIGASGAPSGLPGPAGLVAAGQSAAAGMGAGLGAVTVSTYHAYAAGVLAEHALRIGLEPGSRLLGEAGCWQLVDELVERWDGDLEGVDAARSTIVEAVLALAGESAEHLLEPAGLAAEIDRWLDRTADLPTEPGGPIPGRPRGELARVLHRLHAKRELLPLVAAFTQRKRELEVLDFGDQVAFAARVALSTPEVGAAERDRFRVVLLDEYQDTSHAQLVLLRALFGAGHPVVAVGDPHQSIYGWRGASAGNLQRFGTEFPLPAREGAPGGPGPVLQLSASFRNDQAVLAVANRLADPLRRSVRPAGTRSVLEIQPLRPRPGARPGAVRIEWHASVEDEARAVAESAAGLWFEVGDGQPRPRMAVLCRARAQFPLLEAALRRAGLPVEVVGLGGLLHVPEVADLRAALEVMHDPSRGDSLMRLLTGPAWRLGSADLAALGAWSRNVARWPRAAGTGADRDAVDHVSVIEALDRLPDPQWRGPEGQQLTAEARRRLSRLADVLRGLRARSALALPDLVLEVERALLLDVEVTALAGPGVSPATARAHLDAFIDVAAAFVESGERASLGGFLGWLGAAENQERGLETGVVEQHEDAVQLLTVHGAKGLEWDHVIIPGMVEGTFPAGRNGRSPSTSKGWLAELGAVPYSLRGDATELPRWRPEEAGTLAEMADQLDEFATRCGAHEVAEERRLGYVAVTRARRSLLLTGAVWADAKTPRQPSRFLAELAELAGSGVTIGDWAQAPEDGASNPRQVDGQSARWPDPLGERRPAVQAGADLVRAAMSALAGSQAQPSRVRPGSQSVLPSGTGTPPRAQPSRVPPGPQPVPPAGADGPSQAPHRPAPPEFQPDSPVGMGVPFPGRTRWSSEVDLLLAERDAARSARLEVRLPAHLSASRLVTLAADAHGLASRLRRPMPEPPNPRARRGSAFHAWLERRFGAAALVDVDELPGAIDAGFADPDLAALQRQFLASEWATRTAEAVEVAIETPVAGVILRGRIDAVFRIEPSRPGDPISWDVVDWKTGPPPADSDQAARAVQLAVYRLAWSRLMGASLQAVRAAFFYAAAGQTVRPVDLLDEPALEALIRTTTGATTQTHPATSGHL